MKFREYLAQPASPVPAPVPATQDEQLLFASLSEWTPPYWDPYNLSQRAVQNAQYDYGDPVPLPYTTYTGCFVWTQRFQTIEVGEQYLNWRYVSEIPTKAVRDFTFRQTAVSRPTLREGWFPQDGVGLRLTLITNENGRFWGLATAGDRCTTTTTTTQPPCNCTTHPSMQFTISGVSLRPGAGRCNNTDQICSQFNRTWCLPFRGKTWGWGAEPCVWDYTLSYNNGCPPGSLWYGPDSRIAATLRWPLYKIWDPATSSYVCPAELDFGVFKYRSLNFNPDTGGTFTDGNDTSAYLPTCLGWPTSVTVTANANCNPDPPTTTTTTTTTSTTSGPPGP